MYIPTYSLVLKTLQELGLVDNRGSEKIQPSQRTASGSFFMGSFVKTLGSGKGFESGPARRRFSAPGILKEMEPTVL
jgi:hypothetical protein